MKKHDHTRSTSHNRDIEGGKFVFHKDWRVWLALALMFLAIITYVITLDDSLVPAVMRR